MDKNHVFLSATPSNVGMSLGQAMNGKSANHPGAPVAAPRGGNAQHAMPGKRVGAANRPQGADGGMNLQQAMGGKGAHQAAPTSQQPQRPQAMGGMTMQQATGGKVRNIIWITQIKVRSLYVSINSSQCLYSAYVVY